MVFLFLPKLYMCVNCIRDINKCYLCNVSDCINAQLTVIKDLKYYVWIFITLTLSAKSYVIC